MNHSADIGLVYTHAKGVGGHNHTRSTAFPVVLTRVLVFGQQTCMVIVGADAGGLKHSGQFARALARAYIYYCAALRVVENLQHGFLLVLAPAHQIADVVAAETERKQGRRAHLEFFADVAHHLGGGRSCQSQHHGIGEFLAQVGYFKIVRPEIIAPLRYTVGLVDNYHRQLPLAQLAYETATLQALGRHIHQICLAQTGAVEGQLLLGATESGVDTYSHNAPPPKIVDLVFHQRYKRSHHQCHTRHKQGRHLKGDTFTAAGRKQTNSVAARHHRLYNLELSGSERSVAPVAAEYVRGRTHLRV